jgi:hypothetical protein
VTETFREAAAGGRRGGQGEARTMSRRRVLVVLAVLVAWVAAFGASITGGRARPVTPVVLAQRAQCWQVRVRIFPDDVGVPPGGPVGGRPGCDGLFTNGDRWDPQYCKLDPAWVIIHQPGDPATSPPVYASWVLTRNGADVDMAHIFWVCHPPPLQVTLVTTHMRCRRLCPNFPDAYVLRESDFATSFGGHFASVQFPLRSGMR